MKIKQVVLGFLFVLAASAVLAAQTQLFIPSTASGNFGNPSDQINPLIAAVTVTAPATIAVTYVSGLVKWDGYGDTTGPNGTCCSWCPMQQWPLQECEGVGLTKTCKIAALMGAFVPAARVNYPGFQPLDETKNNAPLGIMPEELFFIGTGKTFPVTEAGTLYLGINDDIVGDNAGGYNVTVSVQ